MKFSTHESAGYSLCRQDISHAHTDTHYTTQGAGLNNLSVSVETKSTSLWLPHSVRWSPILHTNHLLSPLHPLCHSLSNFFSFVLLQFWRTHKYWDMLKAATYAFHCIYCSSTWPIPLVCQQMKRSCRTECVFAYAGDKGGIDITTVTAHQLMFITHHTQHLKKGNHISPLSGKETAKTEPTEVKV